MGESQLQQGKKRARDSREMLTRWQFENFFAGFVW